MVQVCRRCGQMHDVYAGCSSTSSASAGAEAHAQALVGSVLADRYRVGPAIGRGIAGTVFGVQHVTFPRAAALKTLHPQHASADLVSRVFHGEARAAWSVNHPSLVEVFDIGALPDGVPFFLMEHLEGETLAARIGRDRISLGAAVDVVMQLLAALATIHGRDLLLRDLRPHNILLVSRRGCRPLVKILDFGLARLTPVEAIQHDWEARRTNRSSAAIPYYLSPERTRGELGIEPASDLFVIGTIFYEMLAGERPFASTTWNVLMEQIRGAKAVPIEAHRPDVSADLNAFIARVLSPQPRQRPGSAKEMQDELRAIFEGGRRVPSHAALAVAQPHASEEPATFSSLAAPSTGTPSRPLDPLALRPLDAPARIPPVTAPPLVRLHAPGPDDDADAYADETETRRGALRPSDLPPLASSLPPARLPDESRERTVPPPPRPSHESIEVVFEDVVRTGLNETGERTVERASPEAATMLLIGESEDEETETMALTPELKDQVERLMAAATPQVPPTPLLPLTPLAPPSPLKNARTAPPPSPPRRTRPPKR